MKLSWKKLFDWSVLSVEGPVKVQNKNGSVCGYNVIVNYAHHGSKEYFFGMDSEALWVLYGSPEKAAKKTARFYRDRMATKQLGCTLARQK